jgi:hypothetical protein
MEGVHQRTLFFKKNFDSLFSTYTGVPPTNAQRAQQGCNQEDVISLARCVLSRIPDTAQNHSRYLFLMMGNKVDNTC